MISADLRALVKERGISMAAVGRMIGYRCQGGPQKFMHGKSQLRLDTAERLAMGLGYSLQLVKRVNGHVKGLAATATALARSKPEVQEPPISIGTNEDVNHPQGRGEG